MRTKFIAFISAALAILAAANQNSSAQGTAFTYLGGMSVSGQPANGLYDFQFYLRDAASGGNPVGTTNLIAGLSVTNGTFGVTLDFGANFPGASRWLEIGVRTNGGGGFTVLTPRQQILATPYALFAGASGSANVAAQAGSFSGALSGNVTGGQGATLVTVVGGVSATDIATGATAANMATDASVSGTIVKRAADGSTALNGRQITNLSAVSIFFFGAQGGGADDSAAFQAAEAAGVPVYCPPYTTFSFTNLTVTHNGFGILGDQTLLTMGGSSDGAMISVATNVVGFQLRDVVIDGRQIGFFHGSGTNQTPWILTVSTNILFGNSPLRQGLIISAMATNSVVRGVTARNFSESGFEFIGGAGTFPQPRMASLDFDNNAAINDGIGVNYTNDGEYMTISGFRARNCGWGANIAAGNTGISASSFIQNGVGVNVNGGANPAHGIVADSFINHNAIGFIVQNSNNGFEFIGNDLVANNWCFVTNFTRLHVMGGVFETENSVICDGNGLAAGVNIIEHVGCTGSPGQIYNVNGGQLFYNEVVNTTLAMTNAMSMTFARPMVAAGITNLGPLTVMTQDLVSTNTTNLIATFANTNQAVSWLDDKGNWYANGNFNANTFVNVSDRNAKEGFQAISAREILNKVAALPITSWRYKSNSGDRHIGPMAQDFYAAFGLGADNRHITTVDETGIALTAIQGLNDELREKNARITDLEKRLDALETMVRELKK